MAPGPAVGKTASASRWAWRSGGLARSKTAPLVTASGAACVSSKGPLTQPGGPVAPATGVPERFTVTAVWAGLDGETGTSTKG